jgi:hypothetical protein
MNKRSLRWRLPLALGLAFAGAHAATAAGFEALSKTGPAVLTSCNPSNTTGNNKCKVNSLPGAQGYSLVASRSAPLIYNEVVIGTLYEKAWRKDDRPNVYIFGARLVMNAEQWDSSGLAFNVNDVFRQTLPNRRVSVAYLPGDATKALQRAGRTVQGLNEYDGAQPERDNTWVDFRVDVNAADPDGVSSAASPWLLTRTRAPQGFAINDLGIRVLNSDFEDAFEAVAFFTPGYQPNGVPPPPDEEEEEEDAP